MAALGLVQSLTVIKDVNGVYTAAGIATGIQNLDIDSATACTAAQIASYPNAVTAVDIRYYSNSQQLTGTIFVTQTVAAIVTASSGYLQSVHLVQLSNGSPAPLSTTTGTLYAIANNQIKTVKAATAAQIVTYPNALTQINKIYYKQAQTLTGTAICTEAVSVVLAAS